MNYSRIPGFRKIYNKFKSYDERINELHSELFLSCMENLNLRFRLKRINEEKINVVFVCWRPTVWGSLKTVYEHMKRDNCFSVTIVVIPNKKELPKIGWEHEIYESEGGEEFWKGEDVIYGYNSRTKEWYDLEQLKPDYVFFQQPYNGQRPYLYKSKIVSRYAKICYVAYYAFFNSNTNDYINEGCTPEDFLSDISFYFSQNKDDTNFISSKLKRINNRFADVVMTGFPRYDRDNLKIESEVNVLPKKYTLLWTPRWALDEGNCHFFDYKDKFLLFCKEHSDINFIFRPHPQAFLNYVATGAISEEKLKAYTDSFLSLANTKIDKTNNYIRTFYDADCLITDTSSMVAEYFLTGKPIIYCYRKKAKNQFSKTSGYTSSFYFVENWNELVTTIAMLKNGNDPLKEKRKEYLKSDFYIPEGGAGRAIVECIKNDFMGVK